jgi:hypothetical protein
MTSLRLPAPFFGRECMAYYESVGERSVVG